MLSFLLITSFLLSYLTEHPLTSKRKPFATEMARLEKRNPRNLVDRNDTMAYRSSTRAFLCIISSSFVGSMSRSSPVCACSSSTWTCLIFSWLSRICSINTNTYQKKPALKRVQRPTPAMFLTLDQELKGWKGQVKNWPFTFDPRINGFKGLSAEHFYITFPTHLFLHLSLLPFLIRRSAHS